MKKSVLTWLFTAIAFLIVCGVFYAVIPRPKQKGISIEERLKPLEKQISAYRSDNPLAYQVLEKLYSTKGDIYRVYEKYSEAYDCYCEALSFAQKNKRYEQMAELACLMIGMAGEQKQNTLVLSLCAKYQKLIKQCNPDSFGVPQYMVYYWRGMALLAENQIEAACEDLDKGLKLLNSQMLKVHLPRNRIMLYCALGTAYARKQDSLKAAGYLNKTVELLEKRYCLPDKDIYLSLKNALMGIEKNNPPRSIVLGETYHKLAKLHGRYNNPDEYWENMLKAIETYPAVGPQIAEAYFELGEDSYTNPEYYFDKCVTALTGVKSNSAATMLLEIALQYMTSAPDKIPHVLQLTLKALPDSQPDLSIAVRAYQLLAKHFFKTGEWAKSADVSRKSLAVLKKNWNIEERAAIAANCFSYLDRAYKAEKAVQKRLKSAEAARTFMESEGEYCYLPEIYKRFGRIYTVLEQYSQAEKSYREILKLVKAHPEISRTDNCSILQIDALCAIGELQILQKNEKKALAALAEAEKILTGKNTTLPEWYLPQASLTIVDGYIKLHRYPEAVELQSWSLSALEEKDPSYFLMGRLLLDIGMNYIEMDNYKKAKEHLLKAFENFEYVWKTHLYWCGVTCLHLANNARYHKKWQEAEKYYEQTAELLEKHLGFYQNDDSGELHDQIESAFTTLCVVYQWLPTCFLNNNNLSKIQTLYHKVQTLKKINRNTSSFAAIYLPLAGSYIEIKEYKQAHSLIKEGLEIYNSLPETSQTRNSIAFLWWSKAKILHMTGHSKEAYQLGSKAYAALKGKYADKPETLALFTKMLEDMRTGTPFQ
ncbi:MAG: tetratricopeptide repeat protein [Victivallaceae bacterium]